MASNPKPNIICIEDEKDQASQNTSIVHSKPLNETPSQPTNFNPKTFPFLASMLKKITTPIKKTESQALTSQQTAIPITPTEIQMIKPLQIDGSQEVQEVTRIQPPQKLLEVVEDLDGLKNSSALVQNSKPYKSQSLQISINVKANQRAPEPIIVQTVSDEAQKPKENFIEVEKNCNQIILNQNKETVYQAAESIVTNRNINQLIYQFSQKIALYAEKGKQILQENPMEQEKCQNIESARLIGVENSFTQVQAPLSALPNEKRLFKPEEQNQSVYEEEQRRLQVIEQNILLGCQNKFETKISEKNEQIIPQEEQQQFNQPQISQLLPIWSTNQAHQMQIQHQKIEIPKSEYIKPYIMEEEQPVNQNNINEIVPEPYTNLINQKVVNSSLTQVISTEQMTVQNKTQNQKKLGEQVQKVVQKIDENLQRLQKNIQTVYHVPQNQLTTLAPQTNQNSTQMFTEAEINQLKRRIAKMLPDFSEKINDIAHEDLMDIYQMIKKELSVDLIMQAPKTSYHIVQGIQNQKEVQKVPAIEKTIDNIQKQSQKAPSQNLQVIQPMATPNQTSCGMDIEKDQNEEESVQIQKLLKMKNLHEEQLRMQINAMNPEWSTKVSQMNYTELQSMLDLTIVQLRQSISEKQLQKQRQQSQNTSTVKPIQPLISNIETIVQQIPAIQIQPNIIQPKTVEIQQIAGTKTPLQQEQKKPQPIMDQIRSIIKSKVPEMQQKVNSLSDTTIKGIYQISTPEENKTKQKAIQTIEISDIEKDQPSVEFIVNFCTEQFPQLAHDLKQLKEQQIRDIYQQLLSKIGSSLANKNSNSTPNKAQSTAKEVILPKKDSKEKNQQQQSDKSGKSAEKKDTGLKRTHQIMASSNSKKIEAAKPQKKKLSPVEIRKALMAKLPQLKPNIMMLDDHDLQRIYYESVTNGTKNQPSQVTSNHKLVPVAPQKKYVASSASYSKPSIQVVETFDPNRNKKIKTVVLVQREIDIEKQGEVISKVALTEGGQKKKCFCECCKNMDLNNLLIRLGEILQERK